MTAREEHMRTTAEPTIVARGEPRQQCHRTQRVTFQHPSAENEFPKR